nr:4-carboxy-4-hydroxy-2-oxoadipate aldolase/oxaloacetate decarboxylase [uncultured Duganella sp.]
MNQIGHDTLRGLRGLGAATVHEAQGGKGALDSGMKPIDAAMRVAGPAFTVDALPADNLVLHYAMLKARRGDVLVVDAKGFLEAGVWGDVLTEQAMKMGLAGLVINGAVRDAAAIIAAGFPVFARGLSIKGTGKRQPGRIDVPVVIGDVRIEPGDIVIGDQDGLVVVARDAAETVLAAGRAREEKEAAYRERIRNGATTVDLLDLAETLQRLNLR